MGVVYFETGSVSNIHTGTESTPFSVEPSCGSINAGETVSVNVRFAPCDIRDFEGALKLL